MQRVVLFYRNGSCISIYTRKDSVTSTIIKLLSGRQSSGSRARPREAIHLGNLDD